MTTKRWYAREGVRDEVERVKRAGEVFTPEHVGLSMVDMVLKRDAALIHGTYLDPSCGRGNLLMCVLKKKIEAGIDPPTALGSIYGIDIEFDNVETCQRRLIEYTASQMAVPDTRHCADIVHHVDGAYFSRVVCFDTLKWDVSAWKPIGFPSVLNARDVGRDSHPDRVYVGRPSIWGNPFVIGKDGTREEVVMKYGEWLKENSDLLEHIDELRDKDLICWCSPAICHADILIQLANSGPY